MNLKQMQDQIYLENRWQKLIILQKLIIIDGKSLLSSHWVKIISHARGSVLKEARKITSFLYFTRVFITPWRLYAPDILMFSTGSQEYLTVGFFHGN